MGDLQSWLKAGRYLPKRLRDFHDQKDAFKAMAATLANYQSGAASYHTEIKAISWVDLQMLTIDVFLWWMAQHGYTLQRSPADIQFCDLNVTVERHRQAELAAMKAALFPTPAHEGEPT